MKLGRHIGIEVKCEQCGNFFIAPQTRVKGGLGKFCSRNCFNIEQSNRGKLLWGRKDLAKFYVIGGRYCARWYDESGNIRSTTYPKWWWEINIGEIPPKMCVGCKDNNPMNIDPTNFELVSKSSIVKKGYITRRADTIGWAKFKKDISERQFGHKFSEESKKKMSSSHLNIPVVSGSKHPCWRGGIPKEYPKEFYEIRQFVIDRDYGKCQICSRTLTKNWHVHHRDGNREHNDQDNLLTLCASCHGKVHSKSSFESAPIVTLRSELSWYNS